VGRAGGRGPSQLRFRSLLECFAGRAGAITDRRRLNSVDYSIECCYRSAFAMFYLQDPSLLEFQRRFHQEVQSNNLATVFGVEDIPSDTQLRDVIDGHDYATLTEVFPAFIRRMQRSKELERYPFYEGKYLLTVDGAEYFNRYLPS
jgi:hypothetical protein